MSLSVNPFSGTEDICHMSYADSVAQDTRDTLSLISQCTPILQISGKWSFHIKLRWSACWRLKEDFPHIWHFTRCLLQLRPCVYHMWGDMRKKDISTHVDSIAPDPSSLTWELHYYFICQWGCGLKTCCLLFLSSFYIAEFVEAELCATVFW